MSTKRYPKGSNQSAAREPAVNEARARPYGRQKEKRISAQVALTIAEVKRRLKKPIKRSKKEIAWALEIAGIGEGPVNLSANAREYLHSDR
jgi:hypothetical protein